MMAPAGGIFNPGADQPFVERLRVVLIAAHHFAGRFHFRSERRIDPAQLGEREHRYLDRHMVVFAPQPVS